MWSYISFLAFVVFCNTVQLSAQSSPQERIIQIKKMKLVEALNMEEDIAEKFFVRYNLHNRAVDKKQEELKEIMIQLKDALRKQEDDYKQLSEQAIAKQQEVHEARQKIFTSMKNILSEEQYATLLVFEYRFLERMRGFLSRTGERRRRIHREERDKQIQKKK